MDKACMRFFIVVIEVMIEEDFARNFPDGFLFKEPPGLFFR
jgi:hypothetical protein